VSEKAARSWRFRDAATGALLPRAYHGPSIEANTPAGAIAVPADEVPATEVAAITPGMRRSELRQLIARREAEQARPLRELALDPGNDAERQRLASINADIVMLRRRLQEMEHGTA
jgi:hypothetical protein